MLAHALPGVRCEMLCDYIRAVGKDLMAMKMAELKEELGARDEPVSENKADPAPAAARSDCVTTSRRGRPRRFDVCVQLCTRSRLLTFEMTFSVGHAFNVSNRNRPTFNPLPFLPLLKPCRVLYASLTSL